MKNSELLLCAMDLLDDTMLFEAVTYRPAVRFRRWGAVAACVCLLTVGAIGAHLIPAATKEATLEAPQLALQPEAEDVPAEAALEAEEMEPPDGEAMTILDGSSEANSACTEEDCFPIPENGMVFYSGGVRQAMEEQPEGWLFVEISIWKDGQDLYADRETQEAEAQRLAAMGYEVGWYEKRTFDSEANAEVTEPYLYGIFYADDLRQFQGCADCGYVFSFAFHWDGSPVTYGGIGTLIDGTDVQNHAAIIE